MAGETVSTVELVAISGATYRQIHFWTAKGYLTATGSPDRKGGDPDGIGSRRRYAESEVLKARLLVDFLDSDLMARTALTLAAGRVAELPGGFTLRLTRWVRKRVPSAQTRAA